MNFRDYLKEQLETDPEFRRVWEEDEPAFQVIRAIVGARSHLGWTQKELARRMGTSQANISRAERTGKVTPEFLTRFALAVGGSATLTLKVPGSRRVPIDAARLLVQGLAGDSVPQDDAAILELISQRRNRKRARREKEMDRSMGGERRNAAASPG